MIRLSYLQYSNKSLRFDFQFETALSLCECQRICHTFQKSPEWMSWNDVLTMDGIGKSSLSRLLRIHVEEMHRLWLQNQPQKSEVTESGRAMPPCWWMGSNALSSSHHYHHIISYNIIYYHIISYNLTNLTCCHCLCWLPIALTVGFESLGGRWLVSPKTARELEHNLKSNAGTHCCVAILGYI
jgi:hypothetical protein